MNTTQAKQAIARALHELNTFCNDYSEGDMGTIKHYARDFHKVIFELEGVLASSAPVAQPEPTDEQIIAVMRDGYRCNYNDNSEHIEFARAILALRSK